MDASCYCCSHDKLKHAEPAAGEMELDAALQELGMLSTITNSRLDYLNEKVKKKRSSNSLSSAPLCIVQMNSQFVTKFSLSKNSVPGADSESEEENDSSAPGRPHGSIEESKSVVNPKLICEQKMRRVYKGIRRRDYMFRPYDFPWRLKLEDSLKNIPVAAAVSDRASPPTVSRQDSGNKSNPSSPVKSQKSLTNLGSSIFRSRSLDDLEISKLEAKDDSCYETGRAEIDTMSQRISKLHVS
ncbi:uncharacterized protein LOC118186150 [Stegodyphus dumicola]|uniref:uncharacterized protein LOC118186150 n=1 Tax=Stegodyphus dumicola TaxID=202533 RepID=UPI0015AE6516|nr:uncharacterized protein LOC118186150 [Stegodyphus dumicola]XP_035212088.1 uncharacterized protein LOC118186150 [Stegodyphus dumicola]XP_035212089.1 uncharacterized protein LOC118186150 [Stegodyphus dumicola]XP_035212090.1 uncharacterized protein LOC118186150 [Stegodyphus dumicola]